MATSIADILNDAQANIAMVAEAEARLAAAGKTSLSTWDKQAKAVEYLAGRQKIEEGEEKKLAQNAVTLAKAFQGVQKSIGIAIVANAAFDASLAALSGAASPGLIHAWQGSLELLAAELGSELIPVVMSTTDTILDLVDWFANLDDGTKTLIAGGVLAIPAVIGLGHAAMALGPAAKLAGIGVRFLWTSLGPIGALVAGIGIAAAGAAASVAAYHAALGHATVESASKAGQEVNESELNQTVGRLWRRTREVIFGQAGSQAEHVGQAMNASPEELQEMAQRARKKAAELRQSFFGEEGKHMASKAEELANLFDRMATSGAKSSEEERNDAKQQGLMRQARHYNAMVIEAQRIAKPTYSGLAEARKQLQLQALGKSPIEQQLLQIQRGNIPKMRQRLDRILQQLEEMNNRDKRPA